MDQIAEADLSIMEQVHRLICGDCLAVLPTICAASVDVVVTSPPYNLGLTYRGYDDTTDGRRLSRLADRAWQARSAA